jgi:hypothetical protein
MMNLEGNQLFVGWFFLLFLMMQPMVDLAQG